jgi:L-asparagine transporter-like permease
MRKRARGLWTISQVETETAGGCFSPVTLNSFSSALNSGLPLLSSAFYSFARAAAKASAFAAVLNGGQGFSATTLLSRQTRSTRASAMHPRIHQCA